MQGADQRGTCLGLRGERAGDGGGGEAGIGQSEPQGVDMTDETGVDEGDPAIGGDGGQEPRGFADIGGGLYVETQ